MLSLLKRKSKTKIVGLEIRADGLSLSIAKMVVGQPEIQACFYIECNAAERKEKLKEFVAEHGLTDASCRVVMPADQYKVYPVEKPKVEDSELSEAVRWKVKDLLDFELADAVTDVFDFPKDALRGRPEQVNVVASRSVVIREIVNLVLAADLDLLSIDISELAIRNVANMISEDEYRAVSILYLRHGAGMMILVKNGILYFSRHFDFSLQALNDVSQQDSVIQQLALEVQRSFDYFESQLGQVPPQVVYLVGPSPNVPLANMLGGGIAAQVENLDLTNVFGEAIPFDQDSVQSFVAASAALRTEVA